MNAIKTLDIKAPFDLILFDGDGGIIEVVDQNSVSYRLGDERGDLATRVTPVAITEEHQTYSLYKEGENENETVWYRLGSGRSESHVPVRVVDHPVMVWFIPKTSIAVALKAQNSDKIVTPGESEPVTFASPRGVKLREIVFFSSREEALAEGCSLGCIAANGCDCCVRQSTIDAIHEAYRTTSSLAAAAAPLRDELGALTEVQARIAAARIIGIPPDQADVSAGGGEPGTAGDAGPAVQD